VQFTTILYNTQIKTTKKPPQKEVAQN